MSCSIGSRGLCSSPGSAAQSCVTLDSSWTSPGSGPLSDFGNTSETAQGSDEFLATALLTLSGLPVGFSLGRGSSQDYPSEAGVRFQTRLFLPLGVEEGRQCSGFLF